MGFSVYLGGTLSGRSAREVYEERSHAVRLLNKIGVTVYDPMREKYEALMDHDSLSLDSTKITYQISEITHRDLSDINTVDMLIVLTGDQASWGTALEFGYAVWGCRPRKPVMLIGQNAAERVAENQYAWHTRYATKVAATIDEGVEWLDRFWLSEPASPVDTYYPYLYMGKQPNDSLLPDPRYRAKTYGAEQTELFGEDEEAGHGGLGG